MGAAQAALAWCPLLPMRMLLPRSPFTQLQKGGEEFLKGGGAGKQKKGGEEFLKMGERAGKLKEGESFERKKWQ